MPTAVTNPGSICLSLPELDLHLQTTVAGVTHNISVNAMPVIPYGMGVHVGNCLPPGHTAADITAVVLRWSEDTHNQDETGEETQTKPSPAQHSNAATAQTLSTQTIEPDQLSPAAKTRRLSQATARSGRRARPTHRRRSTDTSDGTHQHRHQQAADESVGSSTASLHNRIAILRRRPDSNAHQLERRLGRIGRIIVLLCLIQTATISLMASQAGQRAMIGADHDTWQSGLMNSIIATQTLHPTSNQTWSGQSKLEQQTSLLESVTQFQWHQQALIYGSQVIGPMLSAAGDIALDLPRTTLYAQSMTPLSTSAVLIQSARRFVALGSNDSMLRDFVLNNGPTLMTALNESVVQKQRVEIESTSHIKQWLVFGSVATSSVVAIVSLATAVPRILKVRK